ncbi:pre-mRNA-splicing factor SPF27 [Thrips palmi]|uniref:Pre-mRNA-splicing factor SPF27 n=1 Tax=Thrips palmi TaxID=161013 RepID=A0A6P8YN35_THRPL|nr:pre-mRNA-splicing factor SPF27 [Thrips palmi]XP_034235462.1 pre-mRNA-splicing factor SPF27 [Thrips palmi]
MAGEVIVDALPYIDQGYDEAGVREAALAMVDEETRRYRPTKNYLEHLAPLNTTLFETDMMKSEWERMQQRQPMDVLSMKRYELPPPPAGKMTDIAAWTECVENSQAQLEHQATRIANLELMLDYGCEAWKSYLELLVASVSQAQKNLMALRKDIQEINWERKNAQMKGGEKLRELESTWVGLVSKNYDIEQACVTIEEDIVRLQKEKEGALKRRRIEEERANVKRRKIEQRELERQQREEQMLREQQQLEQLRLEQEAAEARANEEAEEELERQRIHEAWQDQPDEDTSNAEAEQNTNHAENSDSQESTQSRGNSDSNQSGDNGGVEDSNSGTDS